MGDYRKELENRFEEAEFELLFDDYLTDLGEAYQREFALAKASGEAIEMPEELKVQILDYIEKLDAYDDNKPHRVGILRYFLVAVCACIILLASLITVQAIGFDVFGRIGTWTNSIFHFEGTSDTSVVESEPDSARVSELQTVLIENQIPMEFAPFWIPEGFILSSLDISQNDETRTLTAEYSNQEDNLLYQYFEFPSTGSNNQLWIEKDASEPELHHSGDRDYYVFSNNHNWVGVWQGETNNIFIQVSTSKKDLISILDSMGGFDDG